MLNKLSNILVKHSQEEKSGTYKLVASLVGAFLFLLVFPLILYFVGFLFETYVLPAHIRSLEKTFGIVCLVLGLLYVAYAIVSLVTVGRGTPNPLASTKKLVVKGPYKYSRNPIQLGAMIFYLGVGTAFGSIWIGLVMFVFAYLFGCAYHKLVEERELVARFGKEYEDYRDATPFLIPKVWK